jgi:2-methylcitrate dehydratase PrpD
MTQEQIMADQTCSERLACHLVELQLDRLPSDVIEAAKLHILDSLGCILAGSRLEPGQRAYQLAITTSGDNAKSTSTLLGTVEKVSHLDAVQAMATAAHCGELDDIHGGAGTCIGAMVVPALLSMAEKHGGGGKRFLEATIAGYEAMARIGLSIDAAKLFARGWWPSTICGAFGVAAAGAKFCDWPSDKIVNALGIASLHAGGMLTGGNEGATARHLAFGHAAQNGVLALLAGEQGLTGPKYAFEDARGFCLTLCAAPRWNYFQEWDAYHLPEVAFKPYPCARQLHAGVEALLTLMQQRGIGVETIADIELSVPTHNVDMVNRPATPRLRAATLGSGQYVMAVTAWRDKIDLESFENRYLRSDDVRALMARVSVIGSADLDRYFPKYWSGRVSLRLIDGSEHTAEIIAPKGEAENPMTRQDVEDKFLGLATPVLGEEKARAVVDEVSLLDSRDSLASLLAGLATGS